MKPLLLGLALAGATVAPAAAELRILAYGDSNTWGWIPVAEGFPAERQPDDARWGGVLEAALAKTTGEAVTVVVDGMVGRRTDLDGAADDGAVAAADFNGAAGLPGAVARNMPLDAVVIMLGTNDLQAGAERAPADVAAAVIAMGETVEGLNQPLFTVYDAPEVLVVAPPAYGDTSTTGLGALFGAGEEPSKQLGEAFLAAGDGTEIDVFDAATVVADLGVDGIHMTAEAHADLGAALAPILADILEK